MRNKTIKTTGQSNQSEIIAKSKEMAQEVLDQCQQVLIHLGKDEPSIHINLGEFMVIKRQKKEF
ncbi:MAG: hypothetical protein OXC40_02130 [Proteobacteria bacterium]|nr:hypothetical protein [Pseudomonadota bacterium]